MQRYKQKTETLNIHPHNTTKAPQELMYLSLGNDSSQNIKITQQNTFSDSQNNTLVPKVQVQAPKIDENQNKSLDDFTLFHDLYIDTQNFARKAYRAYPKNLWIYLEGKNAPYSVYNISTSGICFKRNKEEEQTMHPGQSITVHLCSDRHDEILTIKAQIVRIDKENYSCTFPRLTYRDETILDILVLEMQKQEIMQRKLECQKEIELEKLQLQELRQQNSVEMQRISIKEVFNIF